ncbi:STE/STE20 protein kinase [Blastomyces parvus]|uniref:STE/STE20 protein kinase n=1 Tax=Blastomyces parvus TaxID=2060905 RepID=A0A2B7XAX6_9EURO|nr:STE/STE20 protein kinase [Blastomyces parvus]
MLGQTLRGRLGFYTVTKQLHDCIWLATNQNKENVVLKSVNHFRLQNERDVLLRFQPRTPFIRPLLDEITTAQGHPGLVLRYLDDDVLQASNNQRLTRSEVKYVARRVLEALAVLHSEGFVQTDVKPSNILVTYDKTGEVRFKDVQLADFGSTVRMDSSHAQDGDPIGTPIFRSPKAHLQMSWGTATDIWSFGAMASFKSSSPSPPGPWTKLISLIYGEGFHIFKPDVPVDHDEYEIKILTKHHRCFGPFPASYEQIADQERLAVLLWIMQNTPRETLKPFHLTTTREICEEDKEFVLKAMKLDPRDRPTAQELLADKWFQRS